MYLQIAQSLPFFRLPAPQLHLQRLPQPADQLPGGVHRLPVQHHRQRGFQHVVRLRHRGWDHAQQVREQRTNSTLHATIIIVQWSVPLKYQLMCVSCFSCEDLQDTDLELGLNNSAFYDQFAIAQVRPFYC